MIFNKKSMLWKIYKPLFTYIRQALTVLLVPFLLGGCASKPWTEPLLETQADTAIQLIDAVIARDAACGGTLEGDIVLFYQNPLEKKAFSGFLQFSMPSSFKFVVENPFGQPILLIAGNQESFQAIDTLSQKFLSGSIRSFGLRNNIPTYFLKSNWASWLTGRILFSSQTITDIRDDRDAKGIWFTFQSEELTGVHHLLLDPDQKVILAHIMENQHGKTVAEVRYDDWLTQGTCRQPQEINITGLDYGTNIHIKLSNVLISDEIKTYQLQPPAGYIRQYTP
jgi:hypothetical protein